jgi:hypothetical protein
MALYTSISHCNMQKIIALTTMLLYIATSYYNTLKISTKNQVCLAPYLTLDFLLKKFKTKIMSNYTL